MGKVFVEQYKTEQLYITKFFSKKKPAPTTQKNTMKKRCTKQTLITSFLATRKHNTVLHNTTTNTTESLTSKF